jgi:hypothetical protein
MSTGYNILYSDPAKNVPAGIFVADGSLNKNSTSLTLVGKNYPSYGQYFETDLVHLLENFAASSPPSNPIEGQLWFDTSDPNAKVLKINDGGISGSRWSPINGVFQQPGQPSNVKTGDIWVDTANQQLKFFNGTDFTIVGPNYSSGTRTGSYPTELTDTNGQSHYAIINYVNDQAIEIISSDNFTPNPVIDGFSALRPGLNISSANVGSLSTPAYPRINGIADSAYNLQISIPTNQKISADSFLRNDIDQRMLGGLNIATDNNSLKIGIDPTFILYRAENGTKAVFSNIKNGGQFNFMVRNQAGASKNVLTMLGDTQRVGINNTTPAVELDIVGSINITNSATVDTLYVNSYAENTATYTGNALQVKGGAGILGTLIVTKEHILRGPLTVGDSYSATATIAARSIIVPTQHLTYDNGDPNWAWRNVYSATYQGARANEELTNITAFSTATVFTSPPYNVGNYELSVFLNGTFIPVVDSTATGVRGVVELTANSFRFNFPSSTTTNSISAQTGAIAQFIGIASSASKLAQPRPFYMVGDFTAPRVDFDGTKQFYTFTATAQTTLITGKASTATTVATDSILVYSTGTTELYQQTKRDFLKDINYQDPTPGNSAGYSTPSGSVVPLGTVLPYTGSTPPAGWLLCNGDQVSSAVEPNGYYNLWSHFNSSGAVYGSADVGYFRLPTLTGPSPSSGPALNYIIKY